MRWVFSAAFFPGEGWPPSPKYVCLALSSELYFTPIVHRIVLLLLIMIIMACTASRITLLILACTAGRITVVQLHV